MSTQEPIPENPPARPEQYDEYLLSEYLDGQLPRRQREQLQARLAEEPALAETLGKLGAVDRLLGQGPPVTGEQLAAQRHSITSALERRALLDGRLRPAGRRWRRVLAPMAAAAALVLAVGIGWLLSGNPPTAPQRQVAVEMLPAGAPSAGAAEVAVEYRHLSFDELHLNARPLRPGRRLPPGTVMVSMGASDDDAPLAVPLMIR